MKKPPFFDRFIKNLPSLFGAIALAIVVWVLAVTNTDPVEKRSYGRVVSIEHVGLNPAYVITSDIPEQITLTLSAPVSTWQSDLTASDAVRAILDLSSLTAGIHTVPVNLQIDARPVKVESYSPDVIEIEIEEVYSESFTINLVQPSNPAIGYEAGNPILSKENATVNGPYSLVDQVAEIHAVLDISQSKWNIDTDLELKAVNENGAIISGVSISPEKVNVKMDITQRGGYRNVSVKVATIGQIKSGYRLTDISSNPLVITVFSTDPNIINDLPGFIETQPLNLTDASEDMAVSLPLDLPAGMTVVGESTINVSVSIAPIQGSVTLTNLPVETIGLDPKLSAVLSPDSVDIILSGALPTLDELIPGNVRVLIDLTDSEEGVFQVEPSVEINIQNVRFESLLPAAIEVEITPISEKLDE